ncbi:hypothetical protein [Neobacillus vireti]|uniref:hypothetical protein n=1 Tax=Neobacillus vireti TaxID=220686 RepID=UPI002FFF39EC
MDKKEQSLLKFYYEKLLNNTFDEKDLYGFLLGIRYQTKEIRSIQELTDFVLLRDQHQGYVTQSLLETRKKFESLGKTKSAFRIEDVFSFKEIKNGLNKALAAVELAGLSNEQVNDFVACLISILQQVKIIEDDREIGKLYFALSNKQIILMAEVEVTQNLFKKTNAVFPVLTANNSYLDIKKQDRYDTPYLFVDEVVEVTNSAGRLEIIIPE